MTGWAPVPSAAASKHLDQGFLQQESHSREGHAGSPASPGIWYRWAARVPLDTVPPGVFRKARVMFDVTVREWLT